MTLADRLKGIKRGGGVVSLVPIQTGANGDVITDAQAGDIVVALHGYVTNATTTLLDGFTSIIRKSSSVRWSTGSFTYYTTGELQYKILTGDETTIPTIPQGSGNWVQYRPSSPITSVTIQELVTNRGTSDLSGAYNSFSQNESLGCIRVVGTAGYTSTSTAQTLSTGDTQTISDTNTSHSKFLTTDSYDAGTYSTTRGSFSSPCFYTTIQCN